MPYNRFRSTLNKAKNSKIPDSPKTLIEVRDAFLRDETFQMFGKTLGEPSVDFYKGTVIEDSFGFTVFASDTIVQHIGKLADKEYYADGTFTLPIGEYQQMFVVHLELDGHSYPALYALMTKRTTAAYVALFQFVESNICKLAPSSFMSDYEIALRNAIKTVYPACSRKACYFHLTQAARKRASKIPQFFDKIRTNPNMYRLYHKFLMLPLLPAGKILEGFSILKSESAEHGEVFEDFIDYYHRQWIVKEGPNAISVFEAKSRTNNMVESHNARLKAKIRSNTTLYEFVQNLAKEELRKANQFVQMLKTPEGVFDDPKPKYEKRARMISKWEKKLKNGNTTVANFLKVLANRTEDSNMANAGGTAVDESSDEEEIEDLALCVRCLEKPSRITLQPCGHTPFCLDCFISAKVVSVVVVCPTCCIESVSYDGF